MFNSYSPLARSQLSLRLSCHISPCWIRPQWRVQDGWLYAQQTNAFLRMASSSHTRLAYMAEISWVMTPNLLLLHPWLFGRRSSPQRLFHIVIARLYEFYIAISSKNIKNFFHLLLVGLEPTTHASWTCTLPTELQEHDCGIFPAPTIILHIST